MAKKSRRRRKARQVPPAAPTQPVPAPTACGPSPDAPDYWYDLKCHVEVCVPHSSRPGEDWGPWTPYLEAILPSRYMRYGPDCEVGEYWGTPAELAENVLKDELPTIVSELHGTYTLSRGSFRIRARVEDTANGVDLAVVEASQQRLAPLLLESTCEALSTLQDYARRLAGAVQQEDSDASRIVATLRPFLARPQALALLAAHRTADRVRARLASLEPKWGEISVYAHEDGLVRIGLVRSYEEACWLATAESCSPDEAETYTVDYEAIRRSEVEATREMLSLLDGAWTVVTPEGRHAEPEDLVLDIPGNQYGIVSEPRPDGKDRLAVLATRASQPQQPGSPATV